MALKSLELEWLVFVLDWRRGQESARHTLPTRATAIQRPLNGFIFEYNVKQWAAEIGLLN